VAKDLYNTQAKEYRTDFRMAGGLQGGEPIYRKEALNHDEIWRQIVEFEDLGIAGMSD